jgi:hypothetical protein
MPFDPITKVYTPPNGAENATPGEIIASATWNSIFTDIANALTQLGQGLITAPQRSITSAGNLPIVGTDVILNINSTSDLTPIIPLASSRAGAAFIFNCVVGSHTQTLIRTAPDTFNGNASINLVGGATVILFPYNDGVNAGYAIQ